MAFIGTMIIIIMGISALMVIVFEQIIRYAFFGSLIISSMTFFVPLRLCNDMDFCILNCCFTLSLGIILAFVLEYVRLPANYIVVVYFSIYFGICIISHILQVMKKLQEI